MVVVVSNAFVHYWYAIIAGVGATVFGGITYLRTEDGQRAFDKIVIDIPIMGDLVQKSGVARFTRTLATLLQSGVNIMEAIEIAARTTGNCVIEAAFMRSRDAISEGKSW